MTPLAVYSTPFVLTSNAAYADGTVGGDCTGCCGNTSVAVTNHENNGDEMDTVVLHTTTDSLTYAARTDVVLKRQRKDPNASADTEKPPPSTVTGVPPSAAPRTGHTDDTDADGRYVKATPLDENC